MENHISFDVRNRTLRLLDQRRLPMEEVFFLCRTADDCIRAVRDMVVRGAPAIGVTAAWGCVLAALDPSLDGDGAWKERYRAAARRIAEARPTAVNLAWAVRQMERCLAHTDSLDAFRAEIVRAASDLQAQDIAICRAIGAHGAACIPRGACVMTHCNAGALATAGYGTALGVIRAACAQDPTVTVIANETRPFLQGARLTCYELAKDHIPVTLACDNACALLMQQGRVQCVVVGADRIARNGDTANKIGTFGVALLARAFHIPFYVAAPLSTIDRDTAQGSDIPIEVRPEAEVRCIGTTTIVPDEVPVLNYAFDVTDHSLISGIITEVGVLRDPYTDSIEAAFTRNGPAS